MTRTAAWLVARLGVVLVPAWIAAALAAALLLPGIEQGSGSPLGGLVPTGSPAVKAQLAEVRAFGNTLLTPVVVVQRAPGGLTRAQLRRTIARARAVDRRRRGDLRVVAPLPSRDRTTVVSYLYFAPGVPAGDQLDRAGVYARSLDPPGLRTGALLARQTEFDRIQHALPWVTAATIGLIVVVLLLTFRAILPPLVVLASAGVAYTIAVHLLGWLAERRNAHLPKEVQPVLVALLLGLVTDYAIFFLAGMRRRLAEGERRFAAADATARDNLPIILTAGLVVALGSLSLVAGHLSVFRAFGPGMALSVVVALAVATTFIPGALALLGPAAFWPSLDRGDREPRVRFWRLLTARPVSFLVAALLAAALLLACSGLPKLRLGFTLVRGQPAGAEVKRAQEDAQRAFPAGIVAPTEVLLQGGALRARTAALTRLEHGVRQVPGVAAVLGPGTSRQLFVSRDGHSARFLAVLDEEALDGKAITILRRVQKAMPELLRRNGLSGTRVSYAGDTALAADTVRAIRSDGVRVGLVVLLVNLVLLALFLRALWAPLYLLAASLLAVGAALGLTTWLMQGALHHDDVTYYVPFAAAVLLLSLGSDYNVFVVGRIWQVARTKPLRDAIAETAPRTSSAITTAGLTLAGSFALLAIVPLRPMRELALTMALGILLDTFVVRSLLVPSLLALFRRREQERRQEPSGDLEGAVHE
ncbi:MAG TPA: MMPL family transporter [Gaiellaceae bacterium]|nr:MMPL family transporter [Gaiellaceae bacterium]